MGSSQTAERLGAVKKGTDLYLFNPSELKIDQKKGELGYDPRAKEEFALDLDLVREILHDGVLVPIIVARDGVKDGKPRTIVIDGRQRTRASEEANRLCKKFESFFDGEGSVEDAATQFSLPKSLLLAVQRHLERCKDLPPLGEEGLPAWTILVPGYQKTADDLRLRRAQAATNIHRQAEKPSHRIEKLSDYLAAGGTVEDAARTFKIKKSQVEEAVRLLECDPLVIQALDAHKIGIGLALKFVGLPRAEQKALLEEEMNKRGVLKGKTVEEHVEKAKVKNGYQKKERARLLPRKSIVGLYDAFKSKKTEIESLDAAPNEIETAKRLLRHVMGDERALHGSWLADFVKLASEAKASKAKAASK